MFLQGQQAAKLLFSITNPESLTSVEFRVWSQWGEDGIIEWLVQQLPMVKPRFVEFGVENYREANTRFLLRNRNWRGLIMDANDTFMRQVRLEEISWKHDLAAMTAFIDRENINKILSSGNFRGEVGLLSIDIDGNDYWVWEKLDVIDPSIVICEYNAVFGDVHAISVPYDPKFDRTTAHSSNLYWGSSIRALEHLANQKGYELLGTNSAGCNAFFLRNDLVPILTGRILDRSPRPSLLRESRGPGESLSHISGLRRAEVIAALPVVCIKTGKHVALGSLSALYSQSWLIKMGYPPENV